MFRWSGGSSGPSVARDTQADGRCVWDAKRVATLFLETGKRPEEVFKIQPANVQLAKGHLGITQGKTPSARRRITLTSAQSGLGARLAAKEKRYLFECDTDAERPLPNVHGTTIAPCRKQVASVPPI